MHQSMIATETLHFTTLRYSNRDLGLVVWTCGNVLNLPQHQQTIDNTACNSTETCQN